MRVGIVGVEQQKLTEATEAAARERIRLILPHASLIVSGECHLGGIDIIAHEEAKAAGVPFLPCPPKTLKWATGYKPRNLKIVENSDVVVCITVKELPETYTGMRFPGGCYHCHTLPDDHVKSGGCWTLKQARLQGKRTKLIVL
jgi:hypothetical protein